MDQTKLSKERKVRALALRQVRLKRGMSKISLSRKSGLTRWTIDRIEAGEKSWNIDSEIIYTETLK
jgi:DNA-binding XRE family transcriptional regulator